MVRCAQLLLGLSPLLAAIPEARGDAQPGATAAGHGPVVRDTGAADSSTVLRRARSAQITFERARRRHLPRSFGGSSPPCGEIIGRFCYWDDDTTDDPLVRTPTPPEPRRIADARTVLLAHLDSASAALPADAWIAGVHVHYLLEAGQPDRAARRVRECRAVGWWCAALGGLVEHAAWRYAAADSLFARALASMPLVERCRWTDLEALVEEPLRTKYRRTPCADRDALNARLWWLADPLFYRSGNDRRTEHYARLTRAEIHRRAASGYAVGWRDDLDEIVRRYGWPSHFTQETPSPGRTDPPGVYAIHESPSYHFFPDVRITDDPRAMADTSWTLRPSQPRERYAPPYGTFARLQYQASLFRRGDSSLIVVAYDVGADSLLRARPLTAALVASSGPDGWDDSRSVQHEARTRGTLVLAAPANAALASIEILGGPRMRRARFGIADARRAPGALRMSDLAFFDPAEALPNDLAGFLPLARASDSITVGQKLGLFWEVYGARAVAGDGVTLDVQIIRDGAGWLRRAGQRAGLVRRPARVTFGWRESQRGVGVAPRALIIDLSGLDPGGYRVEVKLVAEGEAPLSTSRRIEIVRQ